MKLIATIERIKRAFDMATLDYIVIDHDKEHPKGPYFKDNSLVLKSALRDPFEDIGGLLGIAMDIKHSVRPGCTYFALHDISENFDFSNFDGTVTFDKGRLVERTRIYFEFEE